MKLIKLHLNEQYEFINANVEENIIDENKINFKFNIERNRKIFVEKINIFGNNITRRKCNKKSI